MKQELEAYFAERGAELLVFDTIDSTNNYAKTRIRQGIQTPAVILADHQTAGRGRVGNSFCSPKGAGIYMTVAIPNTLLEKDYPLITPATAVAVHEAVKQVCDLDLSIKWVNDLYLGEKKVCGILTELAERMLVIGIGINCTGEFRGELGRIAASLQMEGIRPALFQAVAERVLGLATMMQERDFLSVYREKSNLLGKEVMVAGEEEVYLAEGIGDKGELLLRDSNGRMRSVTSGEVRVRLIK